MEKIVDAVWLLDAYDWQMQTYPQWYGRYTLSQHESMKNEVLGHTLYECGLMATEGKIAGGLYCGLSATAYNDR